MIPIEVRGKGVVVCVCGSDHSQQPRVYFSALVSVARVIYVSDSYFLRQLNVTTPSQSVEFPPRR